MDAGVEYRVAGESTPPAANYSSGVVKEHGPGTPSPPCFQVLRLTRAAEALGEPPAEGRSQGSPAPPCCSGARTEAAGSPARPRGLQAGRRAPAGAARSGPVEAARAHASRGNDAAGPAALHPAAAASRRAERAGRPPAPHNASREAKFGHGPRARTFPPARPGSSPPVPPRPTPGAGLPRS